MSMIFSDVAPSRIGQASARIPSLDYYGAAFEQGVHDSALMSIYRLGEYMAVQDEDPIANPVISPEEANHYAQQEGLDIKFDGYLTTDELWLKLKNKREERDRALILSEGNTGIGRSAGALGTSFLGSVLNPLDFSLMFIPVVGTTGKAAQTAGRVGKLGQMFQRGLITEEAIQAAGLRLGGYTAAVIEGSVGQAITEIPLFVSNTVYQEDYTAKDFATNVALGGLFGAGINTLRIGFRHAFKLHSRLSPETKQNMANAAMEDFLKGEPINPSRLLVLDENFIDAKRTVPLARYVPEELPTAPTAPAKAEDLGEIYDLMQNWALAGSGMGFSWEGRGRLQELAYANAAPSAVPVYRTFEGISDLKVGDVLTPKQRGLAGWSEGSVQFSDWVADYGGVLKLSGDYVLVSNDRIAEAGIRKNATFNDYFFDDMEVIIDDRLEYRIVAKEGATYIVEPVDAGPRTVKTDTGSPINDYRQQLDQAKARKADNLRQEVANDRFTPQEELRTYRDLPTEDDVARVQQEIDELTEMMGIDQLEGNVGQVSVPDKILHERENSWLHYANRVERLKGVPQAEKLNATLTVGEIAEGLFDTSPATHKLFQELLEIEPTLAEVKIVRDLTLREKGYNAAYHGVDDKILMGDSTAPSTIFHEAVHATAIRRMRKDVIGAGNSRLLIARGDYYLSNLQAHAKVTKNKAVKRLTDAYVRAIKHYEKVVGEAPWDHMNGDAKKFVASMEEPHYGLYNIDEFVAEALSNRQFQLFLNSIEGPQKKTLFQEFIDTIKEILGLQPNKGSLLEETLDSYRQLLKGERAPEDYMKGLGRAKAYDLNENVLARTSLCILNAT